MTKEAAIYNFWAGFEIPAYEENSVPDNAPQMYITFEQSSSYWGEQVALSANIWHKNVTSYLALYAKAKQIRDYLGLGGVNLICDEGSITLRQGTPFMLNGADDDGNTKQLYINVTADFNTEV